jgi:hypothetical protein
MIDPLRTRRGAIALSVLTLVAASTAGVAGAAGGPHAGSSAKFAARITKATYNSAKHSARFTFKAIGGKATGFYCGLQPDSKAFRVVSCSSPLKYAKLARNTYKFYVYAVNGKGTKSSIASRSFTI